MQIFADYVEPLTIWLKINPKWAIFITFFISFSESLALIGSIIPGSVTMTAIGILAGSGVMRIDLTLVAATLGAIFGDSLSYFLGYYYREKLFEFWPFYKYPHWLDYGQKYFMKHGRKSVLVGRFIGPLRSVIPVIAGMMKMNQWEFLIANILSGIGWALVYVLPGILIGAAGSELSKENASWLFFIILLLLILIWFLGVALKWFFIRIHHKVKLTLNRIWLHPTFQRFTSLNPSGETDNYRTPLLFFLTLLALLLFALLSCMIYFKFGIQEIDQPIFLFLQSLRSPQIDSFFITINQGAHLKTLFLLNISIILLLVLYKQTRTLTYWLSLNFFSLLFIGAVYLRLYFNYPMLKDFFVPELFYTCTILGAVLLYLNSYGRFYGTLLISSSIALFLILVGFAQIYLGHYWLTSVLNTYFFALSLVFSHYLFFRRQKQSPICHSGIAFMLTLMFILLIIVNGGLISEKRLSQPKTIFSQYLSGTAWWEQSKPILPLYRFNRFGRPVNLFNLQYVGRLEDFVNTLSSSGWQKEERNPLNLLVKKIINFSKSKNYPIVPQLYLNQKPVVMMTYPKSPKPPIILLRLWQTNYRLTDQRVIWIGTIQSLQEPNKEQISIIAQVNASLPGFDRRSIQLPESVLIPLPIKVEPTILLVKESIPAKITPF